jgi:phosphohistidine phosphatase SixA
MGLRPRAFVLLAGAVAAPIVIPLHAQGLSGRALVDALRQGGYVLVMRHASSPRETPDEKTARPDNVKRERQLDDAGRAGATAMGAALRELKIPIGDVLVSPTYRTLETARLAGFESPEGRPELGDRGRSMQGVTDVEGKWLQQQASQRPATGNTLVITHMPNIARAFAGSATDVSDGEALIFKPDGNGGTELVARLRIEEWPTLER